MSLPPAPLSFNPHYEEKIWGGRRLATHLGKDLPEKGTFGESWELSAVKDAQTFVSDGPLGDTSLGTLYANSPVELVGRHAAAYPGFPLLIKFIDAHDRLSIQVNPDDRTARERYGEPFGKTECWYIVDAGTNGKIGIGLRKQLTRKELRESAESGAIEDLLNTVRVKTGEIYFIPAGTIHAILGDLLIYEVQQNSNTTFRLYDWKRTDAAGKPRPLHLHDSVACADLTANKNYLIEPVELYSETYRRMLRVACSYFAIEEFITKRQTRLKLDPVASCRIITVLSGSISLHWTSGSRTAKQGQTLLLPAILSDMMVDTLEDGCRFLLTIIPAGYDEFAARLIGKGCTSEQIAALRYGNP